MMSTLFLGFFFFLIYFLSPMSALIFTLLFFLHYRHQTVPVDNLDVLVIGAGISGITMGKKLKDLGMSRFTILEQGTAVGGTWFWNKFPGCCCDLIAKMYSFSWHYNPAWTKKYPDSDELQAYIEDAASKHSITPHILFNKTVVSCEWKERDGKWKVDTSDGKIYHANVLINAAGILHIPHIPKIDGDQDFKGIKLHTARWDRNVELKEKKVGLIGTGCTGAQVLPSIIDGCKQVTLFQRTPAWVLPKFEADYDDKSKTGFIKYVKDFFERQKGRWDMNFFWAAITTKNAVYSNSNIMKGVQAMMESSVKDPEMRNSIIPDFEVGVKRPVFSDDYLDAFNKTNFKLVTDPIKRITSKGIEAQDKEHEFDIIIYATGFDSLKSALSFKVIGQDGQDLQELWGSMPRAYKALCVPKMPNYFIMFGPNSISDRMLFSESAAEYAADAILKLARSGKKSMTVKEELYEEYNRKLKEQIRSKTYNKTAGGYYVDGEGSNWLLYPYTMYYYMWQTWGCSAGEFDWK